MTKKMSPFDLYSDQTKELIKLWSKNRPGSSFDARHFLVDVLRDLEEISLRNYGNTPEKSKDYETKVQDTLSGSAGYAAEIIEHGLRETIKGNLEAQRAAPDKLREDIADEMTEQFLMLAMECFIAGSAAGKFKLLPREYDLALADTKRKWAQEHNTKKRAASDEEAEIWRNTAKSIRDELSKNPRTRQRVYSKSEIARRVKEKLDLKAHDRTVIRKIYPGKKT